MTVYSYTKVKPKKGPPKYQVRSKEDGDAKMKHVCRCYQEDVAKKIVRSLTETEARDERRKTYVTNDIHVKSNLSRAMPLKSLAKESILMAERFKHLMADASFHTGVKSLPANCRSIQPVLTSPIKGAHLIYKSPPIITHTKPRKESCIDIETAGHFLDEMKYSPGYRYEPKWILPIIYKDRIGDVDGISYR